ncbi:MAG: sensor histidine kinase [Bdellovibrio sp.]
MTTAGETQNKRLIHLKIVYGMGLVMSGIFLLKFNLQNGPVLNGIIVPAWILLATLPPLCLFRFKNFFWSTITALIPLATILLSLIFATGGIDSPGLFWLTTAPLTMAALLGVPGVIVGNGFALGCVAIFWLLKQNGHYLNFIEAHGNYSVEKTFHLLAFLVFTSIVLYLYMRTEQRHTRNLRKENADIENLLRVLLHDIANTLSSMTYQLIRVKEEGEHPHSMQEIDKIERAVGDIGNLLTQVRHLKSVKDGKATLPIKSIPLTMILHEVFESTETVASRKGIKLSLNVPPENIFVQAEKTILSNVILINLLNNAIKFSHPGARIDVRAQLHEAHVILEIQDYGVGIPTEILNNIFNISSNTNRPGTLGEKGTGYGLPLAKEYLQMMSGKIEITSNEHATKDEPQGTKVKLTLPVTK